MKKKTKHTYLHENITSLWVLGRYRVRIWWNTGLNGVPWKIQKMPFGKRASMRSIAKKFVEIEGVNAVEVTDPRDDCGVLIYKDWP